MPIKVVKVTQAMYIAEATPPHLNAPWSTSQPIRFHELCEQLLNRGGHQTDVADAVDSADREWEEKMIEETDANADGKLGSERRRYYRLTSLGRRLVRSEAERLAELLQVVRAKKRLGGEHV